MGIRITWLDLNFGETGHNIYRDTSTMDPEDLPAVYDTVGANITTYDDGAVTAGVTYYYRVSAVVAGVEFVSDEISVEAFEFNPEDLFDSGQFGVWYDFSDLSTMFTDTAGTTPVTSDGDLVARVNDKSGSGLFITQSDSAHRPIYRTNGTQHWLEFDGEDDAINTFSSNNLFRNIGSGLIACLFKDYTPLTTNQHFIHVCANDTNRGVTRSLFRFDSSNDTQFGGRRLTADAFDGAIIPDQPIKEKGVVLHLDYANAELNLYFDGSLVGTDASFQSGGNTEDLPSLGLGIGSGLSTTSNESAWAQIDLMQVIIVGDSSHTPTQIADLNTWLNLKAAGAA